MDNFLYDVVDIHGKKDNTLGSPAIVAAAMLGSSVFSDAELKKIAKTVKDKLLVRRGNNAFGVIVKDASERIYYGDSQYHEAVIWPRDTPYVARLFEITGDRDTVRELLISNLEHQMNEGAIYYNNELFSLPEGKNPEPHYPTSNYPVPVKNQIQYWSQWCDIYIENRNLLGNPTV